MRSKLLSGAVLIIATTTCFSQDDEVASRFEIKQKVSASTAAKDFEATLRNVEKLSNPLWSWGTCPSKDSKPRPCVSTNGWSFYIGEYVPFISNRTEFVPTSLGLKGGPARGGWVPVNRVVDGDAALNNLRDLLAKKQRTDCNDDTALCKIVVETVPANKSERVFAVCNVASIGSEWGAVKRCEPVAIVTPKVSYLRAVVAYEPGERWSKAPEDQSDLEFHVLRSPGDSFLPSLNDALLAVQEVLTSPPLGLNTELRPRGNPVRVIGLADLRLSPVLLPDTWREKVTIRVDVDRDEAQGGDLALSVSFTLQFNKQNTDRPEDLRPPTESQLKRYKDVFSTSIKNRLPALCRSASWKDSSTLVCRSH